MKALCNKTVKHGENCQRKDKTGFSAKIKAQSVAQLGIPEKWQHSICKGQTVLVGTVEQISPEKQTYIDHRVLYICLRELKI